MELSSLLVRASAAGVTSGRESCASCGRTPLPGEIQHILGSGRAVCALCRAGVPEGDREPARAERVHAGDRPLVVGPRAG